MSDITGLPYSLNGIIAVPAAPFTADNRLDENSLRKYVHMALGYGVCGFLAPALAAEVYQLTQEERLRMIRIIRDASQGKVAVIGSATAGEPDERKYAVEQVSKLGCEGVLVFIPFTGEKQYKQEVADLSRMMDGFLMLQDWDFQGAGIPVPVIAELFAAVDRFQSLKIETANAGSKYTAVLKACGYRIHVAGGWASNQMIEGLDRGVHAFMPTVLHNVYKRIYELHHNGDRNSAVALFNSFLPVLAFTRQHPEISIRFNKRLLLRQGIFGTQNVRSDDFPFDSVHERLTDELIDTAIAVAASIAA